ncbi:Clp protease N-terminal domain-containing protein [Micromonospora sp. NBS 11-29]|uniref:Clp protease N-terminal domain-containing protein n=1 Tax=Micromonospora sp. NBS 11-29 TaxID=1960879 RepID=UPI000B799128|nr:Clp protease N-terminal domain-containing protein [Micromonospora sp. NBS 11-29]
MPKVNVYLPDALADRVREARLPISRICQTALTQALDGSQGAAHDTPAAVEQPAGITLDPPANHHVAAILHQAWETATARGSATVEPTHLLRAFLNEGESLVLNTIELLGFRTATIQAALEQADRPTGPPSSAEPIASTGTHAVLSAAAAQATAHSSTATTGSHLLHGLIADQGTAGQVLRITGVTEVITPAVLSALYYGVAFGRMVPDRDTDTAVLRVMMHDVLDRLDRMGKLLATERRDA